MNLADFASAIHDNGNKLIIFKAYVPLLGLKASVLLMHLTTTIDNCYRVFADEDGVLWHRQNLVWMARQSALSEHGLRVAKQTLLEIGLIEIKHVPSADRTTYWRVNNDKLARFFAFAHALYAATRPDNTHTLAQWQSFAKNNPDVIEEFRPLYPRLGQYLPKEEMKPVSKAPQVKNHAAFQPKPEKPAPNRQPCKFVEHWNKQEGVPKCNLGTKGYEFCRKFFAAHRRYEAGNCVGFMLNSDEQERIRLDKVNRIPPNAETIGAKQTPVRSDAQMFRHIEKAARVYQKEYTPKNKAVLPRNLPDFLYMRYSRRYSETSVFLERIGVSPPELLDEHSKKALVESASPETLETARVLKRLFDQANERDENEELSLRDLRHSLEIARAIQDKYDLIPVAAISIFANHFGSYNWFLDWYERYMMGEVWQGMPMGALHPSKDLWRRFVDFTSADIGRDLFTGRRI